MNIENEKHTLESLLQTVRDQSARKVDYVAQTDSLKVRTEGHTKETQAYQNSNRERRCVRSNGNKSGRGRSDRTPTPAGISGRSGPFDESYPYPRVALGHASYI